MPTTKHKPGLRKAELSSDQQVDPHAPNLASPNGVQTQVHAENQLIRSADILLQPMQSVALNPMSGKVTKRMMLSWLYLLRGCQKLPPASVYRFPMAPLMKYLESKDYEVVKADLRGLNATQVEWNNVRGDETSWGVSNLLAQVEVRTNRAGNTIEISLPPKVEASIRDKRSFSELNLILARSLRTTAALNLYRICIAYETNPSHVTFRDPPEVWEPKLSGTPRKPGTAFHYKFFKRDTLKPILSEINQMCDIDVELIEHKEGIKVVAIQFRVTPKPQASLLLEDGNSPDGEVLLELETMGIRRKEAMVFLRNHGPERIRRNIAYTIARRAEMGAAMRDPTKYLKSAIREDYAESAPVATAKPARPVVDQKARQAEKQERVRNELLALRRQRAEEMFLEMSRKESDRWWEDYLSVIRNGANKALLKAANTKGLRDKMVKIDFFLWLAEKTWGELTDRELFEYVLAKEG
jgi:hypothetical protein